MGVKYKESEGFLQCCSCGKVYSVHRYIPFETDYVNSRCPYCQHTTRNINLGQNEDDIYLYVDINIKPDQYIYD